MSDEAQKGCFVVVLAAVVIAAVALFAGCAGCGGYVASWGTGAAKVARDEFGPEKSMQRYMRFKDVAAALDAKKASLESAEAKMTRMDDQYKGVARKDWPRADLEQHNLWASEVAGMRASYNSLAAQYNADMSKINYSFTNLGDLPKGAEKPLPREYRTYESK